MRPTHLESTWWAARPPTGGITMKRIIIAGVAVAALAGSVSAAAAMPVRDVHAEAYGNSVKVTATGYSPPGGQCGARYGITIHTKSGVQLRKRFGKFNACQDWIGGTYWSTGTFRATFNRRGLPHGTYKVCAAAGQHINADSWSAHAICRNRSF